MNLCIISLRLPKQAAICDGFGNKYRIGQECLFMHLLAAVLVVAAVCHMFAERQT